MSNSKSKIQHSKFVSTLACAGITMLILWLALMPADSAPAATGWDKLNHAGAIAVVTGFAYISFQPRRWAVSWAFLYGISLGILIEMLQSAMTFGRTAEWGDVVADIAGAGSVWIAVTIYQRITAPKR